MIFKITKVKHAQCIKYRGMWVYMYVYPSTHLLIY